MTTMRKTAIAAGVLFFLTHVTSIGAVALHGPAVDHADYVLGGGSDTRVLLGAFMDALLMLAIVGTAVTLYVLVKRYDETLALGYVALRTLEAAVIGVGVVSVFGLVTLRQAGLEGTDAGSMIAVAKGMGAVYDWTFLLGPGLVCGTNTLVMATLLRRANVVPRYITTLGVIGGPVIFVSSMLIVFGAHEQWSPTAGLAAVPIFAWEITLALWLIRKGFRDAPAPETIDLSERQPLAAAPLR